MAEITKTVAEFVAQTTFDDLPESVIYKTKQILLDSIGCALGGYAVDRTKIALALIDTLGGNPQASVIGYRRTSCALAAYANAELINALDYDVSGPISTHINPHTTASGLSMAEMVNASGKDLLTAIAVGLEVGGRIAGSMCALWIGKDEPPYWEDTARFSYANSIFGPAACVSKILAFDAEHVANVFGIVGASTAVPSEATWTHTPGPLPTLKYNCWVGWLAQLATTAGLAAERGFTALTSILDGDRGFWQIYSSPFFKPEVILNDLGKTWHLNEALAKKYPCCRLNHAFIDGINKIIKENDVKPDDIQSIVIKGNPFLLTPNRSGTDVRSYADAQFVVSYVAAAAAYHGRKPSPNWQIPSTINDPKIRELMKRVKVMVHPETENITLARVKAGRPPITTTFETIIEITAKGKIFSAEILEHSGSLNNQLNDEELKEKFQDNASYSIIRPDKLKKVIETVYELEKANNVKELTRLLTID